MKTVGDLKIAMAKYPGFRQVEKSDRLPDAHVTYAVVQGENILSIGSGKKSRLKVLMGNSGLHNKAPIVGLCHRLYKIPIEFYVCQYTSVGTKKSKEESELHAAFATTCIDGVAGYKESMKHLRKKLAIEETSLEGLLLDLMETHGDIVSHGLRTRSTADTVEQLFSGYWKKAV